MKHLITLIAVLATTLGYAQTNLASEKNTSSLLWKIEGKGIKTDSYVFGTMHLMSKEKFYFPKKLEKTISKSELLIMEIGDIDPASAQNLMLLTEGKLLDFFNPAQTDSLLVWAKEEMQMDSSQFVFMMGKMKPFVIAQIPAAKDISKNFESYELKFQALAKEQEKKVEGLETVEFQIGLFDDLDTNEQAEMVMEAIRDSKKMADLTRELEQIYLTQDIEALYNFIMKDAGTLENMEEELLTKRNNAWVPKICNYIAEDDTFIAVGAGHLGGPHGIIKQLRALGYTLTPVEF